MSRKDHFDVSTSLSNLIQGIKNNGLKGYDPYDGNNTRYKALLNWRVVRLFNTYFHKFSPVNLRKLFGVKPALSNQAAAFLLRAMLLRSKSNQKKNISDLQFLADHLKNNTLYNQTGFYVWDGLGFPIQMLNSTKPKQNITDIIAMEACATALLQYYYHCEQDPKVLEILNSNIDFIKKHHIQNNEQNTWIKYYPDDNDNSINFNGSIIGAQFLYNLAEATNRLTEVKLTCEHTVKTIIRYQKDNGCWNYLRSLDTDYEKPQIDFHQGFILDALLEYMEHAGFQDPYLSAYKKGLEFYHNKQFLPNGQGIYRYPRKWPVNIHNQAQGIITFTRAAKAGFGDHYFEFAQTIAEWTIEHMQGPDGHFYFLKYPWFTNKIPYIRWSDAAMAYALAVYLDYAKTR